MLAAPAQQAEDVAIHPVLASLLERFPPDVALFVKTALEDWKDSRLRATIAVTENTHRSVPLCKVRRSVTPDTFNIDARIFMSLVIDNYDALFGGDIGVDFETHNAREIDECMSRVVPIQVMEWAGNCSMGKGIRHAVYAHLLNLIFFRSADFPDAFEYKLLLDICENVAEVWFEIVSHPACFRNTGRRVATTRHVMDLMEPSFVPLGVRRAGNLTEPSFVPAATMSNDAFPLDPPPPYAL